MTAGASMLSKKSAKDASEVRFRVKDDSDDQEDNYF